MNRILTTIKGAAKDGIDPRFILAVMVALVAISFGVGAWVKFGLPGAGVLTKFVPVEPKDPTKAAA